MDYSIVYNTVFKETALGFIHYALLDLFLNEKA